MSWGPDSLKVQGSASPFRQVDFFLWLARLTLNVVLRQGAVAVD